MGGSKYNATMRSARATSLGYDTKSKEEIFTQRGVHELMSPIGLKFRESFDSDVHPNSIPIIVGLDVTASMGYIPHALIKDGLPTMMSAIIEAGLPDIALCFVAIGDHLRDRGPLQVGQFESGDAELDSWLQRTWLEGGGGGNGGETYSLAYYFAAKHTKTHAWEKRKQKGILFTIGDEPIHREMDKHSVRSIFGQEEPVEDTVTTEAILKEAQERYHVCHIAVGDMRDSHGWKSFLGENYFQLEDYTKVGKFIAAKTVEILGKRTSTVNMPIVTGTPTELDEQEILL